MNPRTRTLIGATTVVLYTALAIGLAPTRPGIAAALGLLAVLRAAVLIRARRA